jgi:RNA polymerase-associated protein RTF1
LENVENKIKEIEKCKQYIYNNTDITKIIEEKKRFRKAPINYAMTKNELHKEIV